MRKMTTLRTIAAVSPIPNADRLELYTVDGWHVVGQKGEFKVGEKVFYAEIDSMLPLSDERFAFLAPRGEKLAISPYTGEEGRYHRLKTAKLRGQISQGLIFPAEELPDEDGDYSKALGIFKYEPPETAEGVIGDMPGWIEKTDEERVQNLVPELWEQFQSYPDWVATEKVDGESTTIYVEYENGEFHCGVCGRNKEFEERPGEIHWKLARTPMINNMSPIDYLENLCTRDALGQGSDFKVSYVLQGELFGPGIQQNRLGVSEKQILFFNLVKNGKRIPLHEIYHYFDELLAVWVPRHIHIDFPKTIEQAIKQPDGIKSLVKGAKPSAQIEGFVWRCETDSETEDGEKLSFKAISNVYLLQEGD